jgi:arylsulfatase A-like enzyme
MTEHPPLLRLLPKIGGVWLAAAALHLLLRVLLTSGGLPQPLLPLGFRSTLIGTEATLLAALVAAFALPMALLSAARKSPRKAARIAARGAQYILLGGLLLAFAASWGFYALGGCFLDREGVEFLRRNASVVRGFLLRSHPVWTVGLPLLLMATAVALVERFPVWSGRLSEPAARRIERAALAGLVLCLGLAAGGDLGRRGSTREVADPVLGIGRPLDEVYVGQRAEQAGPLTHLLPWGTEPGYPFANETPEELYLLYCRWKRFPLGFAKGSLRKVPTPFEVEPLGPPPLMLRRPILPMDQYVATVDRDRLKRWNVVVILLDSFRKQSLRATGATRDIMPVVEGLAGEGVVYSDCSTPATQTDYAMPAVHSSHYPLRDPKLHFYPVNAPYPRVLIFDVLKALGWRTAIFSSGDETWNTMSNYYQTGGLDTYFHATAPGGLSKAEQIHSSSIGSLDDRVTVTEALKWIDQRGDAPFCLSLIMQNCHLPFPVPDGFKRRFGPEKVDFEITDGSFPAANRDAAREVYADSLAYVDSQLGRLVQHLKERAEWDRTLVVVSGDHGEAFYEHGMPAHANSVFDEIARIPLVIRAPGMQSTVDPRPAELIDIPPSLFHLLGLPPHPSFQGLDLFAPNPRPDRVRYVLLQTGYRTQIGVIQSGFKLVCDVGSKLQNLFDLRADPGETRDLSDAYPEIRKRLGSWMSYWLSVQLDYYGSRPRQATEYPPLLRQR